MITVHFVDKTIVITVKNTEKSSVLHMEVTSVGNRHIINKWALVYTI